jgi:hypothetical protein
VPPPVPAPVAPVPPPAPAPPDGVVPAPAAGVVPALGAGVVPGLAGGAAPVLALVAESEVVVEVVLELLLAVEAATPADEPDVGTVNGGAPDVSLVLDPPPPQALTPRAMRAETAIAEIVLALPATGALMPGRRDFRSRGAPCACRSAGSR